MQVKDNNFKALEKDKKIDTLRKKFNILKEKEYIIFEQKLKTENLEKKVDVKSKDLCKKVNKCKNTDDKSVKAFECSNQEQEGSFKIVAKLEVYV